MQSGQETDFILVSCSGAGVSTESKEKVLRAKQVKSTLINAFEAPENFMDIVLELAGMTYYRQSCCAT